MCGARQSHWAWTWEQLKKVDPGLGLGQDRAAGAARSHQPWAMHGSRACLGMNTIPRSKQGTIRRRGTLSRRPSRILNAPDRMLCKPRTPSEICSATRMLRVRGGRRTRRHCTPPRESGYRLMPRRLQCCTLRLSAHPSLRLWRRSTRRGRPRTAVTLNGRITDAGTARSRCPTSKLTASTRPGLTRGRGRTAARSKTCCIPPRRSTTHTRPRPTAPCRHSTRRPQPGSAHTVLDRPLRLPTTPRRAGLWAMTLGRA